MHFHITKNTKRYFCRLFEEFLMTFLRFCKDFRKTFCLFVKTFWSLYEKFQKTFLGFFEDFLSIFGRLLKDFLRTGWVLSEAFWGSFCGLSQDPQVGWQHVRFFFKKNQEMVKTAFFLNVKKKKINHFSKKKLCLFKKAKNSTFDHTKPFFCNTGLWKL